MRINRHILIPLMLCMMWQVSAQSNQHDIVHNHHHHTSELGIANAPVYFINEKELAYGLHLHYIRMKPHSPFGIGLGYERIFDDHGHNTFGIVGSYRPADRLVINLSPGITFEDGASDHSAFALHFETSYEWEINNLHIGPVFEVAYDPEDIHISLGLHVGIGF